MAIVNEGLNKELVHVTRPNELKRISTTFERADPLMQDISYALIVGDQHEVDRLTKQALEEDYTANTVLDDGLIAGMAVGVIFSNRSIKGSCGGLSAMSDELGQPLCECGAPPGSCSDDDELSSQSGAAGPGTPEVATTV